MIIFLLVSFYCVCWVLIPEFDPIVDKFYYIGLGTAIGIGLAVLCYLCWHYRDRVIQFCSKLRSLISHIFRVKQEHYRPMAIKALGNKEGLEETYAQIMAFDDLDTYALVKEATKLGLSYDDVSKLIAEKVGRNSIDAVRMMRLMQDIEEFERSLENNRGRYTEEEIRSIIRSFKDSKLLKDRDTKSEDDKA